MKKLVKNKILISKDKYNKLQFYEDEYFNKELKEGYTPLQIIKMQTQQYDLGYWQGERITALNIINLLKEKYNLNNEIEKVLKKLYEL